MSQPEWMQKHKEIGQKGDEEVTTLTDSGRPIVDVQETEGGTVPKKGGFLFAAADKKEDDLPEAKEEDASALFKQAGDSPAPTAATVSDDEDPAAMFAAAGDSPAPAPAAESEDEDPAAMFAAAGDSPAPAPAAESEDEDPAAMFAAAGDSSAPAPAAESEDEDPAALFTAAGGSPEADEEEEVIEEDEEEVLVEGETESTPADEGHEVLIDEDGNEIVEDDVVEHEVEDEEVLLDEDGNIVEDEDEVLVDEDGNEILPEDEEVVEDAEEEDEQSADIQTRDLPVQSGDIDPEDIEAQRELLHKTKSEDRSVMSMFIPFFVFLACLAAGLLVAHYVFDALEETPAAVVPTAAPTLAYLDFNPTNPGGTEVAATTEMAPVQGNCDYSSLEQPHVIDQCACGIFIGKIAPDVLARYESLLPFAQSIFSDWIETASSCSARNQALVWLSSGLNNGGEITDALRRDRYMAAYFYIDQGGTSWTSSLNWLSDALICEWEKVTCNGDGSVVGFDLQSNNLEGQLSNAVTMFEFLEFMTVRKNSLAGTIPEGLFFSKTLKALDIYDNNFYGQLPTFGKDIPLQTLHVGRNNLSGRIDDLNIGNAKLLERLDFSENTLNGKLPVELFDLPLMELSFHTNVLTGTIPTNIGKTTSLSRLNFGSNGFTGQLPDQLGSLTNLEELLIRNAPNITGKLPASYGLSFKNLETLVVSGTGIESNIPATFGSMSNLVYMEISKNDFRGALPAELGNLVNLEKLILFENAFSGTIPPELGDMVSLQQLLLRDNNLVGEVPDSLGDLRDLEVLTLQGNLLEGRAPDEVCGLRNRNLGEFVVDCPIRFENDGVQGVICSVPSCCTSCK